MNNFPKVYFIGAGPGDPGLITVRGRELIERADLVLYAGSLVPREVVACARPEAQVVDSARMNLDETHALMRDTVRSGGVAARVHTGDPSLFGSMREQMALLDRDGIAYAVIPGVTAAFATAAQAKISFTVPEATQTLVITRLAGRTPVPERERLRELARHGSSVAVYLSADKAAELARELRAADLPEDTVIVVGHKVGHPEEHVLRATLGDLEDTVRTHGFSRQTMFLVLPGETAPVIPSRLYDAAFGHGFRAARRPPTWPRLAVYAMTSQGLDLARRVAELQPADIFVPARLTTTDAHAFERLADHVRDTFAAYHGHVFIAATGIVVRTIAPLMDHKTTDPAVVVCDQDGRHVISLLSGHLGGANDLARRIASHIGGQAVITTATDTAQTPAMDSLAQARGLTIANAARIKDVNACLAEGRVVSVFDPDNRLDVRDHPAFIPATEASQAQVVVSWNAGPDTALTLHPPCLVAGIGCRRGVTREEIVTALEQVFARHDLAPASLVALASVDLKADEAGLLDAAQALNLPLTFFERAELATVDVPNPSATVREKIGVESVCEAAALTKARSTRLVAPKTIVGPVTVAVALAD